jgi:O-antigen/teichoic acid export membrane protein
MRKSELLDFSAIKERASVSVSPAPGSEFRRLLSVIGDQAVYAATNLVTIIIVGRSCTKTDFGLFVLGLRLIDIVVNMLNVLVWAPYTMLLPFRAAEEKNWYLGSVLVHQLLFSAILATLMRALATMRITLGDGTSLTQIVVAVSATVPFIAFREFSRRMYFATLDMQGALVQDLVTSILQLGTLVTVTHLSQLTPARALAIIAFSNAGSALIWVAGPMLASRISLNCTRYHFGENFRLGKWLFGSNTAVLASSQISPWILGLFSGPGAIAGLTACDVVVNIGRTALTSIQNLLGPHLAHVLALKGKGSVRASVAKVTKWLFIGAVLFSAGVFVFGGHLITAIYGGRFSGLGVIAFILSVNLILVASGTPISYALTTGRHANLEFTANFTGVILQLALALAVVPIYGILGACVALMFGNCAVGMLRFMFYRHAFLENEGL